jgi:hypothetical protein
MRLNEAQYFDSEMDAKLTFPTRRTVSVSVSGIYSFEVSMDPPSREGRPHFIQYPALSARTLEEDNVNELFEAIAPESHNAPSAPGKYERATIERFCFGIVVHAGRNNMSKSGQRIITAYDGIIRSHVRVSSGSVNRILLKVSCTEVCLGHSTKIGLRIMR